MQVSSRDPDISESHLSPPIMSALRLLSSAVRRTPTSVPLGRRGYAEVADKIKLSLVLPHQVRVDFFVFVSLSLNLESQAIFTSADVTQVNLAAATGDMGILANHVPSIEPLRPGVVEVIESGNSSKKWFGEKRTFLSS